MAVHRPERDRAVFALLRAISGKTNSEIARRAGVSPSTIAKWKMAVKDGGTRYPQHWTMSRVARSVGLKYALVEIEPRDSEAAENERRAH